MLKLMGKKILIIVGSKIVLHKNIQHDKLLFWICLVCLVTSQRHVFLRCGLYHNKSCDSHSESSVLSENANILDSMMKFLYDSTMLHSSG